MTRALNWDTTDSTRDGPAASEKPKFVRVWSTFTSPDRPASIASVKFHGRMTRVAIPFDFIHRTPVSASTAVEFLTLILFWTMIA